MGLFRRGGLPSQVYDQLSGLAGDRPNVLSWAKTGLGYAVGLEDKLLWSTVDGWRQVAWHDIQHGKWDPSVSELSWVTTDGTSGSVQLLDAGQLPDLFRERVDATIAFRSAFLPPDTSTEVTITARKTLGANTTISWGWTGTTGSRLTPAGLDAVELEVQRLSTEFDQ